METADVGLVHPAWLPDASFALLGAQRVAVVGGAPLLATVRAEVRRATERYGGRILGPDVLTQTPDVVVMTRDALRDAVTGLGVDLAAWVETLAPMGADAFTVRRAAGTTVVVADGGAGALYGLFELLRQPGLLSGAHAPRLFAPDRDRRMLDHWDNVDVHPVMGQVERGYAGGSIFFAYGGIRDDLTRVNDYARLLASVGINAVAPNNVNVHAKEARLLTADLPDVARLADVFRPWGIRLHLAVNFASPIILGGLDTADPLDGRVRTWWREATDRVLAHVPDFGGYVVKADSEGQPGPFAYGRSHADGANALAEALAPCGGSVHWRAFVYNHHQDWRDRSTDRARAAYDHFAPLDGQFAPNVVLQVKYGPMDFQVREPVSPVLAAMPSTRLALELQLTQEYTGQQRHVCHLGPLWEQIVGFQPQGAAGPVLSDVVQDVVAVANVGESPFWTGHPLAQANLYAFGRLAWDARRSAAEVLTEWVGLTFPGVDDAARADVIGIMTSSWATYERYTAPLGVGFMVQPGDHYGPDVDGYEYSRWGTYHFADRDGVGVDRTRATGTGFTGQYPAPWRDIYESVDDCPDELLLFFHHVPYSHRLHSGSTVIQHIYDTHADGVRDVEQMRAVWNGLAARLPNDVHVGVSARLDEQLRCAIEWRDQIRTYFFRKSGVPDARGDRIY